MKLVTRSLQFSLQSIWGNFSKANIETVVTARNLEAFDNAVEDVYMAVAHDFSYFQQLVTAVKKLLIKHETLTPAMTQHLFSPTTGRLTCGRW